MNDQPTPKSKRGGKRENAGRKALNVTERGERRTLTMDHETIDKATLIGTGNLSEGVRIAVKTFLPD